ncbi:MAG TPA: hypothetical protein VJG90_06030 [Candidatus Nanoarchaeia archaeon]|nr:hypothetical protein [Candidatus Nanoarchaeia archaeon]
MNPGITQQCNHKWVFLEKDIASKPDADVLNWRVLIGWEYFFFCEHCLTMENKIVNTFSADRRIQYVFDPFPSRKKKKANLFQIDMKDILTSLVKKVIGI